MARPRANAQKPPLLPAIGAPSASGLALSAEIRGLISEKDVGKVMKTLRDALDAEANVRAPRREKGVNDYERAPDWNARLTAARILLAYRFGQAPTHAEVHVHGHAGASEAPKSPDEMIEDLRETGADLKKIMDVWLGGMATAVPVAPTPAEPPKVVQDAPIAPIPPQIPEKAEIYDV